MNFMFEWEEQHLTREILFLPREHKIHIFELTCNVLFIIDILTTAFWTIFRELQPLSEDLRRFLKTCPKVTRSLPNIFRKFPKINENFRRLPKIFEETRKCFNHTPTNLSTI